MDEFIIWTSLIGYRLIVTLLYAGGALLVIRVFTTVWNALNFLNSKLTVRKKQKSPKITELFFITFWRVDGTYLMELKPVTCAPERLFQVDMQFTITGQSLAIDTYCELMDALINTEGFHNCKYKSVPGKTRLIRERCVRGIIDNVKSEHMTKE